MLLALSHVIGSKICQRQNEIEILIDQANVESGEDIWCTSVDWASLSFKAIAPVIMIPGNGQCGKFFEGYYKCNQQLIGTSFVQPFEDAASEVLDLYESEETWESLAFETLTTNSTILFNA